MCCRFKHIDFTNSLLAKKKSFNRAYHEWRMVSQSKQSQSQTMQNVHHSSDARILAECHLPLTIFVNYLFIIDQTNILLQNSVQQGHIGFLRFYCVRKEAIGFGRNERVHWHLFYAENNTRVADVFLHACTSI